MRAFSLTTGITLTSSSHEIAFIVKHAEIRYLTSAGVVVMLIPIFRKQPAVRGLSQASTATRFSLFQRLDLSWRLPRYIPYSRRILEALGPCVSRCHVRTMISPVTAKRSLGLARRGLSGYNPRLDKGKHLGMGKLTLVRKSRIRTHTRTYKRGNRA